MFSIMSIGSARQTNPARRTLEPLPLTRLRDAAQGALDEVLATRGRGRT